MIGDLRPLSLMSEFNPWASNLRRQLAADQQFADYCVCGQTRLRNRVDALVDTATSNYGRIAESDVRFNCVVGAGGK